MHKLPYLLLRTHQYTRTGRKKKGKPATDCTHPPRGLHKTPKEAAVSYPIPHPPKKREEANHHHHYSLLLFLTITNMQLFFRMNNYISANLYCSIYQSFKDRCFFPPSGFACTCICFYQQPAVYYYKKGHNH